MIEELTNSIFLELSKIYHLKRIDKNIIGLVDSKNENYDLVIIDRNKPKEKAEITPSPQPRNKGKKTKEELRDIALRAVKTRELNNPGWRKKKLKKKKSKK